MLRVYARGRLGQNSCPRGRNFTLNGTQGEVGVSLKNIFSFYRGTHFHSVTAQMQSVVTIYYHCIILLFPFNGNSVFNGSFASKLTENVVILHYSFSLSDCYPGGRSHLSLLSATEAQLEPWYLPINNA